MAHAPKKQSQMLWLPGRSVTRFLPRFLATEGFAVASAEARAYHDDILDRDDWWLYRAGAICRLRSSDGVRSIELVPLPPSDVAAGISEVLEGPRTKFPHEVPGKIVGARLRECMPTPKLGVRAGLDAEEKRYLVTAGDGESFELDVFAGVLRAGGPRSDFTEVQVGLIRGKVKAFKRLVSVLVDKLNMTPVSGDVLVHRMSSVGVGLPEFVERDDLIICEDDRFVDAAYRVFRRHFGRMLWHEPGTRLGLDPEHLHDMRVATRRMRAALRVFGDALPQRRVESLRRNLRWLGGTLGAVRDLDVYSIHLAEELPQVSEELQPALDIYRAHLVRQRAKARRDLLKTLETKRYASFVKHLRGFLDAGAPIRPRAPRASEPVTAAADQLIRKKLDKVLEHARSLNPQSADSRLHSLRIRCKRLRYACEFFTDLYGKPAVKFASRVTALQDALGDHQDAVVARATLSRFSETLSAPAKMRRTLHMAMGHLMAQHAERAREGRARFFRLRKHFDRKKVRKPLLSRIQEYK